MPAMPDSQRRQDENEAEHERLDQGRDQDRYTQSSSAAPRGASLEEFGRARHRKESKKYGRLSGPRRERNLYLSMNVSRSGLSSAARPVEEIGLVHNVEPVGLGPLDAGIIIDIERALRGRRSGILATSSAARRPVFHDSGLSCSPRGQGELPAPARQSPFARVPPRPWRTA